MKFNRTIETVAETQTTKELLADLKKEIIKNTSTKNALKGLATNKIEKGETTPPFVLKAYKYLSKFYNIDFSSSSYQVLSSKTMNQDGINRITDDLLTFTGYTVSEIKNLKLEKGALYTDNGLNNLDDINIVIFSKAIERDSELIKDLSSDYSYVLNFTTICIDDTNNKSNVIGDKVTVMAYNPQTNEKFLLDEKTTKQIIDKIKKEST